MDSAIQQAERRLLIAQQTASQSAAIASRKAASNVTELIWALQPASRKDTLAGHLAAKQIAHMTHHNAPCQQYAATALLRLESSVIMQQQTTAHQAWDVMDYAFAKL